MPPKKKASPGRGEPAPAPAPGRAPGRKPFEPGRPLLPDDEPEGLPLESLGSLGKAKATATAPRKRKAPDTAGVGESALGELGDTQVVPETQLALMPPARKVPAKPTAPPAPPQPPPAGSFGRHKAPPAVVPKGPAASAGGAGGAPPSSCGASGASAAAHQVAAAVAAAAAPPEQQGRAATRGKLPAPDVTLELEFPRPSQLEAIDWREVSNELKGRLLGAQFGALPGAAPPGYTWVPDKAVARWECIHYDDPRCVSQPGSHATPAPAPPLAWSPPAPHAGAARFAPPPTARPLPALAPVQGALIALPRTAAAAPLTLAAAPRTLDRAAFLAPAPQPLRLLAPPPQHTLRTIAVAGGGVVVGRKPGLCGQSQAYRAVTRRLYAFADGTRGFVRMDGSVVVRDFSPVAAGDAETQLEVINDAELSYLAAEALLEECHEQLQRYMFEGAAVPATVQALVAHPNFQDWWTYTAAVTDGKRYQNGGRVTARLMVANGQTKAAAMVQEQWNKGGPPHRRLQVDPALFFSDYDAWRDMGVVTLAPAFDAAFRAIFLGPDGAPLVDARIRDDDVLVIWGNMRKAQYVLLATEFETIVSKATGAATAARDAHKRYTSTWTGLKHSVRKFWEKEWCSTAASVWKTAHDTTDAPEADLWTLYAGRVRVVESADSLCDSEADDADDFAASSPSPLLDDDDDDPDKTQDPGALAIRMQQV